MGEYLAVVMGSCLLSFDAPTAPDLESGLRIGDCSVTIRAKAVPDRTIARVMTRMPWCSPPRISCSDNTGHRRTGHCVLQDAEPDERSAP